MVYNTANGKLIASFNMDPEPGPVTCKDNIMLLARSRNLTHPYYMPQYPKIIMEICAYAM